VADIFDQVAPDKAPAGDIFDQVAPDKPAGPVTSAAPPAAPQQPQPQQDQRMPLPSTFSRPIVGDWSKPIADVGALHAERLAPGILDAIEPGLGSAPQPLAATRGAIKGGAEFLSALTAPQQVALMVAIPAVGQIPEVGHTLSRLVSAGFSIDMLVGAAKQSPKLRQQISNSDLEGATQTATSMALNVGMAALSGKHALTGKLQPAGSPAEPPPTGDIFDQVATAPPPAAPGAETPVPPAAPPKPSATIPTPDQADQQTTANAQTIVAAMSTQQAPPAPEGESAIEEATRGGPGTPPAAVAPPVDDRAQRQQQARDLMHPNALETSGEFPVQPQATNAPPTPKETPNAVTVEQPEQGPQLSAQEEKPVAEGRGPVVSAQPGAVEPAAAEPPASAPVAAQPPASTGPAVAPQPKPAAPESVAETPQSPETPETKTGYAALTEAVYQKLKAGESLGNMTEFTKMAIKAFGGSRTSGQWTPKDAYDAMEAGINKHLLDRGKDLMTMDPIEGLKELRNLMGRVTTQGVRTDEQIKNQQFSTPPTESYVAARVANLKPEDVVLEPSAGNGGLAVWPKSIGAETHVNEIAPRRQQMLQEVGFGKPTTHDGELINALLDPAIKPTVILMNPPFSSSTTKSHEAKNKNLYGYNHVDQALQRLAPGGRLVAILGGGQANEPEGGAALNGGQSGKWFDKVGKQYSIRANVRVNGKEYQKYGTNFATRIIVIDKSGPNPGWRASVVAKNVDTLEEAYNLLKDVEASRPAIPARPGNAPVPGQQESGTRVAGSSDTGPRGDSGGSPRGAGAGQTVRVPRARVLEPRVHRQPGDKPVGGEPQPRPNPPARVEPQPEAQQPTEAPAVLGPQSSTPLPSDERTLATASEDDRVVFENAEHKAAPEEDQSAYVTYQPSIKGKAHPGEIVETKTMATVPLPPITYKPALPAAAMTDQWLSNVQVEAIAIAGQQNEIVLPGGFRGAALIGDGTGLGKGSEAAGIMWDNYRQGRKRIVMFSQNNDLMAAVIGDLHDVGAKELTRGFTRQPNGKYVAANGGASVRSVGEWDAKDKIKHDGILFSTYGMIPREDKKGNLRIAQIEEYLKGDDEGDGAYVLFDESHNLKNAVANQGLPSKTGVRVKEMLERLPKLRSVSLSATAASDVGNLGYLDRLGLWGPGTPFPNGFREFQQEVAGGGMAAMELIARELKSQGKYIARTLSFKGVTYETATHNLTPEQKEVYRTAATAWASVSQAAEATIARTTNGGGFAIGRLQAAFYGAQLRFWSVLITTLKIPTAVELANRAIDDGKAVVITLVNTNEAAQNREKNKGVQAGDNEEDLTEYDFGPKEILLNMVRENYPVQQWVDDVTADGTPTKRALTRPDPNNPGGKEIPVNNPQAEAERDALLAQIDRDLHLPDNPLDILINNLGGHTKVAEITGRKEYFDRGSGKFVKRGDSGTKRADVNLQEAADFQGGKKEIAVLSGAGGTGISLHSGLNVKNQKQRLQITLQVGWQADKAQQMLGRTHRTNQAHPPEYVFLVSDLGGEQRFVATIQQRLQSLGALSKGQKDATSGTGTGEFNPLSTQGRQGANGFYTALLRDQPVPGTGRTGLEVASALRVLQGEAGQQRISIADRENVTRLFNRIMALDPDLQNAVFRYYGEFYDAAMERAIADGTVDTGVKRMPGDEFSVGKPQSLAKDPATGAETTYYPVEAMVKRKRVSPAQLDKLMKAHKDDNPRIFIGNKNRKMMLVIDAQPRVTEAGAIIPSYRVATAANGEWTKLSQAEVDGKATEVGADLKKRTDEKQDELNAANDDLEFWKTRQSSGQQTGWREKKVAEIEAELHLIPDNPMSWAKARWKEEYDAAPSHITVEHHLIGGAVMRYWNAIKEATCIRHSIFTTVDSKTGQRVVGIDIPPARIKDLIARITGGASMVDANQLYSDVLKNGMSYTLEGNIQVRQGRVGREKVIQLMPPAGDVAKNLVTLGAVHERGVVPIYYIPTGKEDFATLSRILETYPVKPDTHAGERGAASLDFLTGGLFGKSNDGEPETHYSGLGAFKDKTVRNLSQLEKANKTVHAAAVTTAASRAQAAALIRMAAPRIEAALGKDVSWLDFRRALIESRLRGIRGRWSDIAEQAADATDDDLMTAMGNWMFHLLNVLHYDPKNPDMTAAALMNRGDTDTLRMVLQDTFDQAAANTASIMPEAEFKAITNQPRFDKGLQVYKSLMEKPIAQNHEANEGVFSDALGPLDTYYPLIPITDADEIRASAGRTGRAVPYRKPKNAANAFATGQAKDYDPDMEKFAERIHSAFRANNKAALNQAMQDAGLLQKLGRDAEVPDEITYQGRQFKASVVEMSPDKVLITPTKTIRVPATRGIVPSWLEQELQPILDRRNISLTSPDSLLGKITKITLAGPLDAVIHSANLMGTLVANTPFLGESLAGKVAGSLPFTKRAAALFHILSVDPSDDAAAKDIIEMAGLGVVPEKFASETYSRKFAEQTGAELKRFSFGPTLYGPKGIDIRARLVMYRLARALLYGPAEIDRRDSETRTDTRTSMRPQDRQQLYLVVNQLGNYNRALAGSIERSLKASSFSPFYTAGSTMVRNGIHAWTGTGPMPKDGAGWRAAQAITGGALGTIAMWALLHKVYRGKWPWEEKDSKLLKIKALPGDRNSQVGNALWGKTGDGFINVGWTSPLVMRGARALGIEGMYDTAMAKGSADQMMESALAGAINSATSPVMGPPAKAVFLGLTGAEPYLTGLKDDRGQPAPQFFPAVKPQKPGAAGFLKQHVIAPVINMNSLFANTAAATGLSHGIMRDENPDANKWLRMVVDMAAPQLVDRPVKHGAHAEFLRRQRVAEQKSK
jgi:hypothetical protein